MPSKFVWYSGSRKKYSDIQFKTLLRDHSVWSSHIAAPLYKLWDWKRIHVLYPFTRVSLIRFSCYYQPGLLKLDKKYSIQILEKLISSVQRCLINNFPKTLKTTWPFMSPLLPEQLHWVMVVRPLRPPGRECSRPMSATRSGTAVHWSWSFVLSGTSCWSGLLDIFLTF